MAAGERFADTFAKWALNDKLIGVRAGYGVKAPKSLKAWGKVLMRGVHLRPLGRRLQPAPAIRPHGKPGRRLVCGRGCSGRLLATSLAMFWVRPG